MARIMVVDDSGELRHLMGRLLAHAGHEAILADCGAAALRMIAEQQIDLVLLDICMPEMDGIAVLEALGTRDGKLSVPVVMLTALSDGPEQRRATELGACDYLVKSRFGYDELEDRVQRNLALSPHG